MIRRDDTQTAHAIGAVHATPAGGARLAWRGRGCGFVCAVALVAGLASGASATGAAGQGRTQASLPVPSGQDVFLNEVLIDSTPGEVWVRFRFLAPRIGSDAGDIGYDVSAIDMFHLCENLAMPYLDLHQLDAARVVISMSDRLVTFGASDPDATQFFEAFSLQNARCIWEGF